MKVLTVAGARPNFVKIAPIMEAMSAASELEPRLVHTGQHYDYQMSQAFFEDLAIPDADVSLEVRGDTHAEQTGSIMIAFERVCYAQRPDLVLVVGDVNSTLASALAAKKMGIPIAHVEAGLRSGDMQMPEEINRRCTDALTDLFFTTEPSANENLRKEGIAGDRIFFVGNVMIDTLFKYKERAAELGIPARFGLRANNYAILTLHRPSNTDDKAVLAPLLEAIRQIAGQLPVIFPIHPRTKRAVQKHGLESLLSSKSDAKLLVIDPLRYLEFIGLLQDARIVLTDSGGLQEETTALGVPCLTMRDNTERPITCELGTNRLIRSTPEALISSVRQVLTRPMPNPVGIDKWDGKAADRIVDVLRNNFWSIHDTRLRPASSLLPGKGVRWLRLEDQCPHQDFHQFSQLSGKESGCWKARR